MQPLPIDPLLPEMLDALRQSRRLVVVAEPGAGKTTRVPPAIVRSGLLGHPHDRVIMLQPRRVAARAAASRIASENNLRLGNEVGYQVRGESRMGPDTQLQILTEGILTRRLIDDPFLEGVGCVILDEFHERHIDTDLCIAMLREVCATVREDLYLVVMSATLDAQAVSRFLGDCPVVNVPGRIFPVEVTFAPPPPAQGHARNALPLHILRQIREVLDASDATGTPDREPGDILVFLPGIDEIRRTAEALEPLAASRDLAILPLHGSLPFDAQARVLEPIAQRKIILATNIAETSLTIDGVRTVIDSGLARIPSYDPHRGMDRLELKHISRASAVQRSGRAGRTAPGRCIRLWSQAKDKNLDAFGTPEILRVDLAPAILHVHEWGKSDPRQFGWFEMPPEPTIASAERLLNMLGALVGGSISPLGKRILDIPAHPRLARLMLTAGDMGLPREGAAIAALLSEKDILRPLGNLTHRPTRTTQGRSDVLYRLDMLEAARRNGFSSAMADAAFDVSAARQVVKTRDELASRMRDGRTNPPADREAALLKLVLLAYPDRLCRRRENNPDSAVMVGGSGVTIDPTSTVIGASLFVAVDARDDTRGHARQAIARIISEVEEPWLAELFPHLLNIRREVTMDEQTGKVSARVITQFVDLLIRESVDHNASPEDIATALAQAAQHKAPAIFQADKSAAQILQRLAFLSHHMPERSWPIFTPAILGEILARQCSGKRSLAELSKLDLPELLLAELDWKQRQQLNDLAPEQITVPSGSHIRLEYDGSRQPTLAVRLQEVFGWMETPRLADGRVPLVMELLGPNFRPVQITSDLASFWRTAYFEVRKDLRVRYPKHSWPEDPLSAKPEARGRPRR